LGFIPITGFIHTGMCTFLPLVFKQFQQLSASVASPALPGDKEKVTAV
jgi:hypothetical protein